MATQSVSDASSSRIRRGVTSPARALSPRLRADREAGAEARRPGGPSPGCACACVSAARVEGLAGGGACRGRLVCSWSNSMLSACSQGTLCGAEATEVKKPLASPSPPPIPTYPISFSVPPPLPPQRPPPLEASLDCSSKMFFPLLRDRPSARTWVCVFLSCGHFKMPGC